MEKDAPLQKNEGIQLGRRNGGSDLDGYVFVNLEHAKKWLSQKLDDTYFVKYVMPQPKENYCHACGTHHTQQEGIYSVRRELEIEEFLKETQPAKTDGGGL